MPKSRKNSKKYTRKIKKRGTKKHKGGVNSKDKPAKAASPKSKKRKIDEKKKKFNIFEEIGHIPYLRDHVAKSAIMHATPFNIEQLLKTITTKQISEDQSHIYSMKIYNMLNRYYEQNTDKINELDFYHATLFNKYQPMLCKIHKLGFLEKFTLSFCYPGLLRSAIKKTESPVNKFMKELYAAFIKDKRNMEYISTLL